MQINEIHSVTIALSEEEHAKLEAASDILNEIMDAFYPCHDDDKIGNKNTLEENFAKYGELTDMTNLFDWLCAMTAEGCQIGNYNAQTE